MGILSTVMEFCVAGPHPFSSSVKIETDIVECIES